MPSPFCRPSVRRRRSVRCTTTAPLRRSQPCWTGWTRARLRLRADGRREDVLDARPGGRPLLDSGRPRAAGSRREIFCAVARLEAEDQRCQHRLSATPSSRSTARASSTCSPPSAQSSRFVRPTRTARLPRAPRACASDRCRLCLPLWPKARRGGAPRRPACTRTRPDRTRCSRCDSGEAVAHRHPGGGGWRRRGTAWPAARARSAWSTSRAARA